MEINNINDINTIENLLVHLQLDESKKYACYYCRTSELVCKKIIVLTPEIQNFNQREFKIKVVNQIFNNSPESINEMKLDNIFGIIPLNRNELLITLIFNEKYYEVACEAILANTMSKRFKLIGLRTIDDKLFPKYVIETVKQIGTGRFDNEYSVEYINIYSIEVFKSENQKNNSLKDYFQPSQHMLNRFRNWKSGTWCTPFGSFQIDYDFEDKLLKITSKFEYTIKVKSDNMSNYYDDEEERYKYLCYKKQFSTRLEMRIFIQAIENTLIDNNFLLEPTSNLEKLNTFSYNIVCSNIDVIFRNKISFIEYDPNENGYYLNPDFVKNYHKYSSWFGIKL